jgi:hypothetical protein
MCLDQLAAGVGEFGLVLAQAAFICGGLPICSAQNFPAALAEQAPPLA